MSIAAVSPARDLPPESRTPPRDPRSFQTLAGGIIAGAATALGASVYWWHEAARPSLGGLLGFVVLVAMASLLRVRAWRGLQLSVSFPVLLSSAFLFGPTVGGLIALTGSFDPRELRREVSLLAALANRCQISLSVLSAGYVFQLLGGNDLGWPYIFGPALLALASDYLVNASLVVTGASLRYRLPWRQVLRRLSLGRMRSHLLAYLSFGLLAVLLTELYRDVGAWALASVVPLLLLAHEAFARTKQLDEQSRELVVSRQALAAAVHGMEEERRDERARIASALHDDAIQALQLVTLHSQVIREDLRWGRLLSLEEDIPGLVSASQQAQAALREAIQDLRKSPLGRSGLADTLRLLARDLKDISGVRIDLLLSKLSADDSLQLLIYQVAKEALTNAVQHARAQSVTVTLTEETGTVRLVVRDDGEGFDPESLDSESHFGVGLMKERVAIAGGDMQILSEAGYGTTVAARFPL